MPWYVVSSQSTITHTLSAAVDEEPLFSQDSYHWALDEFFSAGYFATINVTTSENHTIEVYFLVDDEYYPDLAYDYGSIFLFSTVNNASISGQIVAHDDRVECVTENGLVNGPCTSSVDFSLDFGVIMGCPESIVRSSVNPVFVSWPLAQFQLINKSRRPLIYDHQTDLPFNIGVTTVTAIISSFDKSQLLETLPMCTFDVCNYFLCSR